MRRATEEAAAARIDAAQRTRQAERDAFREHQRELREYQPHLRHNGVRGAAAAAAAGYVSAHSVGHGIADTIKAGARYQHEVVALQNAGRTPHEMHEIDEASRKATQVVPTATYEENLKVINETTGAFGSLHHAIENLPFMQKASSVLHAAAGDKIHDGPGELGNKLARFFEMRGTAGNTPVFQREAGEMIRAMMFTRGNFNPAEMVNFAQQAKASLPLYSERFLSKIVPSLVTEYGGDRAGTAANAFRNVIMGKANDQKQAEEWVRLGLLNKKQARIKGGHVVAWKAGAVKDTNQALLDPEQWATDVLLPALRKGGVNVDDKLELSKALGTLFRNSNSNMFAEAISQKLSRERLHKDEANMNASSTMDDAYKRNLTADPTVGITALKASLDNLMTTVSSPAMSTAAGVITSIAGALNKVADLAAEHPNIALGGGAAAAGGALAASGYASYKLLTGFGLPAAAAELSLAGKMLQGAAVKQGAPVPVAGKLPLLGTLGAAAPIVAAATLAGLAGGKQQPEAVVRLRDELSELNKKLDRHGAAAAGIPVDEPARAVADARVRETQAEIERTKAALAQAEAGGDAGPSTKVEIAPAPPRRPIDVDPAKLTAAPLPPARPQGPGPSVIGGLTDDRESRIGRARAPAALTAATGAAADLKAALEAVAQPRRVPLDGADIRSVHNDAKGLYDTLLGILGLLGGTSANPSRTSFHNS